MRDRRTCSSLAACITMGLAGASAAAIPIAVPRSAPAPADFAPAHTQVPHSVLPVTSCADDGSPGTLRSVVAAANSGDIVDVGGLSCSTITLLNGQIGVAATDLTIRGQAGVYLDIQAYNAQSRIFAGRNLTLDTLHLSGGKYRPSSGVAFGGCVYAQSVYLKNTVVTNCTVLAGAADAAAGGAIKAGYVKMVDSEVSNSSAYSGFLAAGGGIAAMNALIEGSTISGNKVAFTLGGSADAAYGGGMSVSGTSNIISSVISGNSVSQQIAGGSAFGGGIDARGAIALTYTTLSGNAASASSGIARGGGLRATDTLSTYGTTISYNSADGSTSDGGGVYAHSGGRIFGTSIDHNAAANNAGIFATYGGVNGSNLRIGNSTVSDNSATQSTAVFIGLPASIYGSTIAFNRTGGPFAGLYVASEGVFLESTIVSNNTSTFAYSFDFVSTATISGDHDLIEVSGSSFPPDTIEGTDPMLGALAQNGGPTRTRALMHGSPAIDSGINGFNKPFDQRGSGFPRTFGAATDIGAFEWQGGPDDEIFADGFD